MGVDKKKLTEEDIKFRYITPAITTRWKPEQISMEAKAEAPNLITDGLSDELEKAARISAAKALFGILPPDTDLERARVERLL